MTSSLQRSRIDCHMVWSFYILLYILVLRMIIYPFSLQGPCGTGEKLPEGAVRCSSTEQVRPDAI